MRERGSIQGFHYGNFPKLLSFDDFAAQSSLSDPSWFVDSGATNHIITSNHFFCCFLKVGYFKILIYWKLSKTSLLSVLVSVPGNSLWNNNKWMLWFFYLQILLIHQFFFVVVILVFQLSVWLLHAWASMYVSYANWLYPIYLILVS